MSNINKLLMTPIHLDALWLKNKKTVVEANVDFSQLPYTDGKKDYNSKYANISESIVTDPFENLNFDLEPGIHLHWAMPDALTRGQSENGKVVFPELPNRWLITKNWTEEGVPHKKEWIVESDYLYPENPITKPNAISYPWTPDNNNGEYKRFRYLGRSINLENWQANTDEEYLSSLNVLGYGNAAFSAFYPNCYSVFGFHDAETISELPDNLYYDVIGWYNDPTKDHFKNFVEEQDTSLTIDELKSNLKEAFNWDLQEDNNFPEQIICHSRIRFAPSGSSSTQDMAEPYIVTGNTGTEALSAYLGYILGEETGNKAIIEEQLEVVALADQLAGNTIDTDAQFQVARHNKGFTSIDAGRIWSVRQDADTNANSNETPQKSTQINLPEGIAHTLNDLNELQWAYNQAIHELQSLRGQLFGDWYKYMLSSYPTSSINYPDIDKIKHFLESKSLPQLKEKEQNCDVANLIIETDPSQSDLVLSVNYSGEYPTSLAATLAAKATQLINELVTANSSENMEEEMPWLLKQVAAPRYWQPNDPVVLLSGEVASPSERYGRDHILPCNMVELGDGEDIVNSNGLNNIITTKINEIEHSDSCAFSTWVEAPWNPITMEWEVEVFPVKEGSSQDNNDQGYSPDFITRNYHLPENAVDLEIIPNQQTVVNAANVFTGSCTLTPYANTFMKNKVRAYLNKYNPNDDTDEIFHEDNTIDEIGDIIVTYEAEQSWDTTTNPDLKASDIYYTMLLAYEELLTLNCLSQKLDGFNEAMLMHRKTQQLEIADPLAFNDYQSFTEDYIRNAIGDRLNRASEPLNDFNPIRSGAMRINKIRLIDSFGQYKDIDTEQLITTELMSFPTTNYLTALPPRFIQAARLNFRWLSANYDDLQMNDHPATTPICGWVVPNNLDNSLMVYDNNGKALGFINQRAEWEAAPGTTTLEKESEEEINTDHTDPDYYTIIRNEDLRKMVDYLIRMGLNTIGTDRYSTFIGNFITVINNSIENIDPATYAQHQSLSLLMSRPLALVRASLNLELKGNPAIHQGWREFGKDIDSTTREVDNFTNVEFPIRMGEFMQLNDGLVGYWKETKSGDYENDLFYSPQTDQIEIDGSGTDVHIDAPYIHTRGEGKFELQQTINDAPQILSMLFDPRGVVHATAGILPSKTINIPPDQYAAAMDAIEVTFLTAPVLSNLNTLSLPLRNESGYQWSWIENKLGIWNEIRSDRQIKKVAFQQAFDKEETIIGEAIWNELVLKNWLLINDSDENLAEVSTTELRSNEPLDLSEYDVTETEIEILLSKTYIADVAIKAGFSGKQYLREGWLKLTPQV